MAPSPTRRAGSHEDLTQRMESPMFEFLTTNPAVALLKEDHDRVKELFD